MRPAVRHRAEADRALAAASRLANRRPPKTARRAGLLLDRIDTLLRLADTHLRAALVADRTPAAEAVWAQLLTPDDTQDDTQDPQTAAPAPRRSHEPPVRVVAEGSAKSNGLQGRSRGCTDGEGVAARIAALTAALRTTEAERDQAFQALDKAGAYRAKANQILDAVNPLIDAAEKLWDTPNPEFSLFQALREATQTARAAITHPTEDLLADIQRANHPQPEEARQ